MLGLPFGKVVKIVIEQPTAVLIIHEFVEELTDYPGTISRVGRLGV